MNECRLRLLCDRRNKKCFVKIVEKKDYFDYLFDAAKGNLQQGNYEKTK